MDDAHGKLSLALSLLAALALLGGCEELVPYHTNSGEHEREEVHVQFRRPAEGTGPPVTVLVPSDGSQRFLPIDPSLLAMRLGNLLRDVAGGSERPPSGWSAVTTGELYRTPPTPKSGPQAGTDVVELELHPAIQGFTVERWVKGKLATTLDFSLVPASGAFRVVLDRITIHVCRAKVADMSWRQWWTRIPCLYGFGFDIARPFGLDYSDQAVDMAIDLLFGATWTDAHGRSHTGAVSACHWTILDVPILGTPLEVDDAGGFLPPIPASVCGFDGAQPVWGLGNFTLHALVMEQDDMTAGTVKSRQQLVEFLQDLYSVLPIPGQ